MRLPALALAASLAVVGGIGSAMSSIADVVVSQTGKRFTPVAASIEEGQALLVVNDDEGVVHHAYVEADGFDFDSGDQKPGSRTRIVFPRSGEFQVLCGIHPKMRLAVTVHGR